MSHERRKTLASGNWTWQVWHKRKWTLCLGSKSQIEMQCLQITLSVIGLCRFTVLYWIYYAAHWLWIEDTWDRLAGAGVGSLLFFSLAESHSYTCIYTWRSRNNKEAGMESDMASERKSTGGQWNDAVLFLSEVIFFNIRNSFFSTHCMKVFVFPLDEKKTSKSFFRAGEESFALSRPLCFIL